MLKLLLLGLSCVASAFAASARAEDNAQLIEQLSRTRILTCLHPTVNTSTAIVELGARTPSGVDTTQQRVKVFYDGLIRKNALEMDVLLRASGTIRQFRVNVLSDTSPVLVGCPLTKGWTDY
jgi:hypothetical protein